VGSKERDNGVTELSLKLDQKYRQTLKRSLDKQKREGAKAPSPNGTITVVDSGAKCNLIEQSR
jgi:hypothetical protein